MPRPTTHPTTIPRRMSFSLPTRLTHSAMSARDVTIPPSTVRSLFYHNAPFERVTVSPGKYGSSNSSGPSSLTQVVDFSRFFLFLASLPEVSRCLEPEFRLFGNASSHDAPAFAVPATKHLLNPLLVLPPSSSRWLHLTSWDLRLARSETTLLTC